MIPMLLEKGGISIHALREEGDSLTSTSGRFSAYFYPRPPRGGRLNCLTQPSFTLRFLSTPSARRATGVQRGQQQQGGISIHALREEGDFLLQRLDHFIKISIHALREEGDLFISPRPVCSSEFLSTPSARRATCECIVDIDSTTEFLSTPSARRATLSSVPLSLRQKISIHALREEGDVKVSGGHA